MNKPWVIVLVFAGISVSWIVVVTVVQSKAVLALTPLVLLLPGIIWVYFLQRSIDRKAGGR